MLQDRMFGLPSRGAGSPEVLEINGTEGRALVEDTTKRLTALRSEHKRPFRARALWRPAGRRRVAVVSEACRGQLRSYCALPGAGLLRSCTVEGARDRTELLCRNRSKEASKDASLRRDHKRLG